MNFSKIVKSSFVGLFLGLLALNAQAQNKTVTGKVLDAKDGSPIAAASVVAKGTSTGTQTGADGSYKLTVPSSTKVNVPPETVPVSAVPFASSARTAAPDD